MNLTLGVLVAAGACGLVLRAARIHRDREIVTQLRHDWGRARWQDSDLDWTLQSEAWIESRTDSDRVAGVDAQTWSDLDLDEVVSAVDRTRTGLGRQALYRRLRSGASWSASTHLETLVGRFGSDARFRERTGACLAAAGRALGSGFWVITRPGLIPRAWWYWCFPILSLAMGVSIVVIPLDPRAVLPALVLAVVNIFVRVATSWRLPGVLTPMRQLNPLIGTANCLSRSLRDAGLEAPSIDEDLARLRSLRRVARWVSRDPTTSGELIASGWEYLNIVFLLDANALLFTSRRMEELASVLERVATWVGEVDVAFSVASLRAEPESWCIPEPSVGPSTRIRGVWHPLVESPVPNDADLEPGTGIVISGANMSGKSTYLRTIGVAAVLAHGVHTSPATSWDGPTYRVRSLMGRSDDLLAGKSYYQVEVDGIVALLREAEGEQPTLFLLDEILRGTNTTERLATGEAVLRAFLEGRSGRTPHIVAVATHDGELVARLSDLYTPWHFRETVEPGGLHFDFMRRAGPATTRTAIALLEASGAPAGVVDAARERARQIDETSHR
ncbi:MAG: hypothetical protein RQ745_05880 [Longimicrobiales bacterium]|nr:hypothetical protein [Longimicrobiales bacterium]